jgi:amino acid adenylation domain-containing protein
MGKMGTKTICEVFEQVASAQPHAVALSDPDGDLTYSQLEHRANQLARRLGELGVVPGDVVGVWAERSATVVVMLLAVLKAGAAYLALDQRQPAERQWLILRDAAVKIVLTKQDLAAELPETVTKVRLDGDWPGFRALPAGPPDVVCVPESPAYVAYTSGSTGQPKGVCVPHHAVVRLVVGADFLPIKPEDVFLQFAPLAFDASTLEVWGPLLNGARLVIAPPGDLGLAELSRVVRGTGVTILWLTAGLFHQVADTDLTGLRGLRYLIAGGDVLSPAHVNRALGALPATTLINGYGPTENTTFTCCQTINEEIGEVTVPIGRPITGTDVYVLDEQLRPVPQGEEGELFAAGRGLAHGYLNSPVLTAARFLPDPFAKVAGARMYRTGDRVRESRDGDLLFLGRADRQVKVRGFRLELGEVEAAVAGLPAVAQAAVVVQRQPLGGTRLLAYVVGAGAAVSPLELRQQLAKLLPSYAVPSLVRVLDALPLTANGKVDRAALEDLPSGERPEVNAPHREAGSPLEKAMVDLWTDHLGIIGIGADDDFFELGGHSLLAVSILEELHSVYGSEISPLSFYLDPSPAGLARTLHDTAEEGSAA